MFKSIRGEGRRTVHPLGWRSEAPLNITGRRYFRVAHQQKSCRPMTAIAAFNPGDAAAIGSSTTRHD